MRRVDQPLHERGGAQDIRVHDQQVIIERRAGQPQGIETAPAVLIVDDVAKGTAPVRIADCAPYQLLLMAHHQHGRLDPGLQQRVEIPHQERPPSDFEKALGAIARHGAETLTDTCCQNHGLHGIMRRT